MKVMPIQTTIVDWDSWRLVCDETWKYNPTAGLDKSGIKSTDPAAFCGSLSFDNNPFSVLREGGKSYLLRHSLLTIAVNCSTIETLSLRKLPLVITEERTFKNDLLIISGSIYDYKNIILTLMNQYSNFETRLFLNNVYLILQRSAFSNLFQHLTKRELSDKTFILE